MTVFRLGKRMTASVLGNETAISPKFSGHETFTMRHGWIKKAVDAVTAIPDFFRDEDSALVDLGVGKNMVRSIRHWATATGIIEEADSEKKSRAKSYQPSQLGEFIFADDGADPYMEDSGTLWLVHYLLAHGRECPTTWYWMFNRYSGIEFTADSVLKAIKLAGQQHNWAKLADNTLIRDINCFVRTYLPAKVSKRSGVEDTLECPLTELGLLRQVEEDKSYVFSRGEHPSLPTHIFAYALARFWKGYADDRQALQLDEIAFEPGSPGQVFKLSKNGLVDHLEQIGAATSNKFGYDETAGLMQAYRRGDVDPISILAKYYKMKAPRKRR